MRCASDFFFPPIFTTPLRLCVIFLSYALGLTSKRFFICYAQSFSVFTGANYMGSVIVPHFCAAFSCSLFFHLSITPLQNSNASPYLPYLPLSALLLLLTAWSLSLHSGLTLEPQFIPRLSPSTYSVLHYHPFLLAVKRHLPRFYIPSIHLPPTFTPAICPPCAYLSHYCCRCHLACIAFNPQHG